METNIAPTPRPRPWMSFAGWATVAIGAALLLAALVTPWLSLGAPVLAVIVGACIELAVGARLATRGGAGTSHVLGGTLLLAFAAVLASVALVYPAARGAGPIGLMLGIALVCNGIFRGSEVPISRPRAWRSELFDAVVSFAIGVVLLVNWQDLTALHLAFAVAFDLIAGGVAMVGSSGVWARHPEWSAYDDQQERISHVRVRH